MDYRDIPVFINNRNHLDIGFKDLVAWLLDAGTKRIEVVDNDSSYLPLLQWYNANQHIRVHRLKENVGPRAFWYRNMHAKMDTPYVVTDSDLVPTADCPKDLIGKCLDVFNRYGNSLKVGPALRIDNLPDYYKYKNHVIKHETQFWTALIPPENDAREAAIDTTFALYGPRRCFPLTWPVGHYRLAPPYVVEHKPWYTDSDHPTQEDLYYKAHSENDWSYWHMLP